MINNDDDRPVLEVTAVRFVSPPSLAVERITQQERREQHIAAVSEHALRALLREEIRWGRIESAHSKIHRIIPADGSQPFYAVKVVRVRDRTPRWVWTLSGGLVAAGALVGLGVMLYQTRYIWLALAGFLALCWLLINRSGHSGGCVGLHCAGCRG